MESPKQEEEPRYKFTPFKILILAINSYISLTISYCGDNPAVLEKQLTEVLGLSYTKYALLFSFEYYTGLFLPLLGGMAIDRVGAT